MEVQWLLSFVKVVPEVNGIHSDSSSCAPRWGGFIGYIKMVPSELVVCDGNSFLIAIYKQIQVSHVNTWHNAYGS